MPNIFPQRQSIRELVVGGWRFLGAWQIGPQASKQASVFDGVNPTGNTTTTYNIQTPRSLPRIVQ